MKGDFTRCKFGTERHYRSVRMQQGRVLLDSDWNSQMEIESHLSKAGAIDAVGKSGGALQNAGFGIISDKEDIEKCKDAAVLSKDGSLEDKINSLPAGDFLVPRGRYYVDGILCENDEHTFSSEMKDFQDAFDPQDGKDYLVYLDVWERHITSVEDPDIREVALGGPDTTTRVETVWQVKAKDIEDFEEKNRSQEKTATSNNEENQASDRLDCKTAAEKLSLWCQENEGGLLSVRLGMVNAEGNLCKMEPASRYRGQDNHLYRVEIHQSGIPQEAGRDEIGREESGSEETEREDSSKNQHYATFKWSRDNGSTVFAVENIIEGSRLRIRIGRDPISILKADDWVEILGESTELKGKLGKLVRIMGIDESERIVTLDKNVDEFLGEEHIKIRRWDGGNEISYDKKFIVGEFSFELEDGIVVIFSGDKFRTGDYWTFRARELTGNIDTFERMPPHGIEHHCSALAILSRQDGKFRLKEDCRRIHLSLTEMTDLVNQIEKRTELSYVGGSGQEGKRGKILNHPLLVGVSCLNGPVSHAWVKFEVKEGGGRLGGMSGSGNSENAIEVETGDDGVAGCCWVLGHSGTQQAMATLRDKKDLPVFFYADFMMDPDARLRMDISRYGMIIAVLGMLGCLIGVMQEESRWFALFVFIAFAAMLIASIVLRKIR
ncbi:MAG: hypothetical protein E4G89_02045 [Methanothrix sp.]|nr:MAG: hypothetical protein E4G89_02045 [Methanothrix sp.]